ncbi:hypothetical protein [Stenotrophomonas indicatrix]|uniref:hypothetical protein n=1 Tax=Stenotrophomonas indicatrix TaxID=2045451 RepID=UPI0011873192|nr:hypothetical protein [Stenotrophomonas indicatrix]
MNANYLQLILEGRPADAHRLAAMLRPRVMPTTLGDALKSNFPFLKMLPQLPTEKARGFDSLESLTSNFPFLRVLPELPTEKARRFDPLETLGLSVAARKPHGLVTGVARTPNLEVLRSVLPSATFAGLVKAVSAPASSLRQRAEGIAQLLADALVEEGAPSQQPSSGEMVQAGEGFSVGDEAIAHVIRSSDPTPDASWWESLSYDAKINMLFALVLALITLVPQIPSYINSYREWRDGSDAITNEQGRQLIAAAQATKGMMAEMLALERKAAASDASFQREVLALQRESRPWMDSLLGQPCEVRVATSVRDLDRIGRSMKEIDRLQPGDLVLCMGRHGKWLRVAYDDKDGDRIYGFVRKKHLAWEDLR